ncbi:MAG: peroxidase family protein, partial [Pseudomonadota bacterium]
MLDQARPLPDPEIRRLTQWERPLDGRLEAEHVLHDRMATRVMAAQLRAKTRSGALNLAHLPGAKPHLSATGARLEVAGDLPEEFQVEHWRPDAHLDVALRLASAAPMVQADDVPDIRIAALRIDHGGGVQDLLFDDRPAQPARNAKQYLGLIDAMGRPKYRAWAHLAQAVGPGEALRMRRALGRMEGGSLAEATFWTAGAMLWGDAGPVRLSLRPLDPTALEGGATDPNRLRSDLVARLARGDLAWEVRAHRYVDDHRTPVEDASVPWPADDPVVLGRLVLPARNAAGIEAQNDAANVEAMAFNPWNTTAAFRPLGSFNRARKVVADAMDAHRTGMRFYVNIPIRNRVTTALLMRVFDVVEKRRTLHQLPTPLALMNLTIFRHRLRTRNLLDSDPPELVPQPRQPAPPIPEEMRSRRSFDGTMNDLSAPDMGKIGATFGRNMPPDPRPELLYTPDPHTISQELLARKDFIPATTINVLAAAWIQFQAHDWVQHSRYPLGRRDITVPMPEGRTWRNTPDGPEETEMRISGDRPVDPTESWPMVFPNRMSHWWDGTELYGPGEDHAMSLLEGPKFRMEDGYLPRNIRDLEVTGFNESWWLGLSAMHTLFAREHNTVVDMLRGAHRDWSDQRLYHTARLIVSALIAKIHTVEWTPAILATDIIDKGLNANWGGLTDPISKAGAWL